MQALLASSHLLHEVKKNAVDHGVIVDGVRIDIGKMMAQKDKAVSGLTKGVEGLFKKYKVRGMCCALAAWHAGICCCAGRGLGACSLMQGCLGVGLRWCSHVQVEYVKGWGKFVGPNEVEVALLDGGSSTISTKNTIIATGSEVAPLPGIQIDEERCAWRCQPC